MAFLSYVNRSVSSRTMVLTLCGLAVAHAVGEGVLIRHAGVRAVYIEFVVQVRVCVRYVSE